MGRHLFKAIGPKDAVATYCQNKIEDGIYFDVQTASLEDTLSNDESISHAVILLGKTNFRSCFDDKETSYAVNVLGIKKILDVLRIKKIKPIFISSDYVFDGKKGMYREDDEPNPIVLYGKYKYDIECYLKEHFKDFLILRLAKVVGNSLEDGSLFTNWLEQIMKKDVIKCAHDQIISPIFVDDVVKGIIRVIQHDKSGIYHLSGDKPYSRIEVFELFFRYAQGYVDFPKENIVSCSINDFDFPEVYPLDISLDPSKIVQDLGMKLTSLEVVCDEIVKRKFVPDE